MFSKYLYLLFLLSMNNISSLLLMFLLVPIVVIAQYFSIISLMFGYLYLGVIILFIVMSIMMLNVKMSLMNPMHISGLVMFWSSTQSHMMSLSYHCVMIMFIMLLMLMYMMSDLLHS